MGVFCAIDFETADPQPDSACAVGLARVEDGQVVRVESRLCRPPRGVHPQYEAVHGLSYQRLRGEPRFGQVWPLLAPVLDGAAELVAHNVPFDRKVLTACCEAAGIAPPKLPWVCTLELARKRWKKPLSNKLPEVCRRLDVPLASHHEAGADAEAAARVLIALRALDRPKESAPEPRAEPFRFPPPFLPDPVHWPVMGVTLAAFPGVLEAVWRARCRGCGGPCRSWLCDTCDRCLAKEG